MPEMRSHHGVSFTTGSKMGLRVLQFHRLRNQGLDWPVPFSRRPARVRRFRVYLTLIANLPGTFIPISFATSEPAGSRTTTSPVQSSLRLLDLQLGQTGPALIIRQFLQALSVKPCVRPSSAFPSAPPESTRFGPGRVGGVLCRFFHLSLPLESSRLLCGL